MTQAKTSSIPMIENILYPIPFEPYLLPVRSWSRGSGSACDEQDPSLPFVSAAQEISLSVVEPCLEENNKTPLQNIDRGPGRKDCGYEMTPTSFLEI
jgi:hypothetical protein